LTRNVSRETNLIKSHKKSPDFSESLLGALNILNLDPTELQLNRMLSHFYLLEKYNKVVNLTALKNPEDIAFRLFADSLMPLDFIQKLKSAKILDFGPGGGFPAIPLRIFLDDTFTITMIERRQNVVFYLEELISNLSLKNISFLKGLAQDLSNESDLIFSYDLILNKATFPTGKYLTTVSPFLKTNGLALHWAASPAPASDIPSGWVPDVFIKPQTDDIRFPGVIVGYRKLDH
jgi:16S rRNA (guanine527-N7)-methyltransferase